MNILSTNISNLPLLIKHERIDDINKLVNKCVITSKLDWDSFETSWDFETHPLLKHKENGFIQTAYQNWEAFTEKQFNQLKANEEELNRIFIDIYGLQDELTPEVADKDITIRKADYERDIKSYLSYATGCMFGRYSLDRDGLVYAGQGKIVESGECVVDRKDSVNSGEWGVDSKDQNNYSLSTDHYPLRFPFDDDNIIPILDEDYFTDDIAGRFIQFVKVSFGEKTLDENLNFIAKALEQKSSESAVDCIRRYFLNSFFKDHVQVYKKRPIYWLFSSGKQKAFNALIYMHRYDKSVISRIRTDYLHELQTKMENKEQGLQQVIDNREGREKLSAQKELAKLRKQLDELRQYDEQLRHFADMQIEIDLDDGVKVNYAKFEHLLAKI